MNHPKINFPFETLRARAIPSLRLELQEYRHRVTGARHIHLAADDSHNVFLVGFLTVPQNSTGIAHILEHTALCGSQRYPVRDPFFMMIRRSLNTFMNAFTGSDWTAYPFASQNKKDFNNLLDVYLDAVFFPLLDELDFAQEGHRVEFSSVDNTDTPLVFKGVVFNEMKGAMSSPIQRLAQEMQSALFPTTTYHYNSGGEPAVIPDLTHAQLKAFHAQHYHPSNAVFMTYGDIPAAEHQLRFEECALSRFQPLSVDFNIPDEQRFHAPVSLEAKYALDDNDKLEHKTHIVLGWLLGRNTDPQGVMRTRILAEVLLDNSSSPLRHALETSELGEAPSPLCGFDDATRETVFACGLEGSNPEHAAAVEELILNVIRKVATEGVSQDTLEAVLHQLELNQREVTGDGFPYGLQLMLTALTPAMHGGEPAAALDLDAQLEPLREEIKNPDFIKDLAHRLLLDNPHRVRLTMIPDAKLSMQQTQAENQRLAAIQTNLGIEDKRRIVERARALQERQNRQDDPELLPRIGLADVPAELNIAEGVLRPIVGMPAAWYAQGTNGMLYQQLVIELPTLEDDLLELLPLYSFCVSEVGSWDRDYMQTQALQAAVTGGIGVRYIVRGGVDDVQQARGVVVLAGKALSRNQADLTRLLWETFDRPRFDELPRLRELIAQLRAQREESITDQGHMLAMIAASAGLSPAAALSHRWDGLLGIKKLKTLDDNLDNADALVTFAERLGRIHQLLKNAPRQLLVVSEAEQQEAIATVLNDCWARVPAGQCNRLVPASGAGFVNQGWATSTQVNFCAKAYPTVPPNHPDAPALQVLGDFLRNGYLHRAIREQGGAYGAGAGYHADSGSFRFFSYRDPRLRATLDDFDGALAWLERENHPARSLEEAILGVVAGIDRPGSPAGEAISAFFGNLFDRTPEQRQVFRRRVLAVSLDDLKRVAETYLRPQQSSSAVLSNASALREQTDLEITMV